MCQLSSELVNWSYIEDIYVQLLRFPPMNVQKINSANYLHLQMEQLLGTCQNASEKTKEHIKQLLSK